MSPYIDYATCLIARFRPLGACSHGGTGGLHVVAARLCAGPASARRRPAARVRAATPPARHRECALNILSSW